MSEGTSVIVATIASLVLMGIQFYLAWRIPAKDGEAGTPDGTDLYFRSFGCLGWGGGAGSYTLWNSSHWPRWPGEPDAYP